VAAAQAPAPPRGVVADFTVTPLAPLTAEEVTFKSVSTVTGDGNTIVSESWDLDGDGVFGDQRGSTATRTFARAGAYAIALAVRDAGGRRSVATRTVTVSNRPPTAAFAFAPGAPVAGEAITFASQSSDPEGPVAESWDLDGNGTFDDAAGPVATALLAPGTHVVGLRVVDGDGADAVATQEVTVAAPAGAAVNLPPLALLLSPFPVVRIVGTAADDGTDVQLITITGPPGASVVLRCRGRSCPFTRRVQPLAVARRGSGPRGTRTLRVVTFAGGPLTPGTWIQVFVIDPLRTGKYTRFVMRPRRPPDRVDRCAAVGREIVVACPGGPRPAG
jgi:PKD repeat protein